MVLALYVSLLRDLQAFRIEKVTLSGASSGYGPRLEAELEGAARTMTTLHVDEARLSEVAGRYPAVIDLSADPGFPHALAVRVRERPPVGLVEGRRGRRVPVAADGSLLEGQPVDRPLPTLPGRASSGRRARRATTASAARLTAAAPAALAASLKEVTRGPAGWTVDLREGPSCASARWRTYRPSGRRRLAVLRSRAARGARYVDLRLPDRPAAGGFPAPIPARRSGGENPAVGSGFRCSSESQSDIETMEQP